MEKIKLFTSQFVFADSVIKDFYYDLVLKSGKISIETKNEQYEWGLLVVNFYRITEIQFKELNTTNAVISDSIFSVIASLGYVFDFSPCDAEIKLQNKYRKSDFYLVCNDFKFSFHKYTN